MSAKNCPYCSSNGRLATNHSLSLYRCTNHECKAEYEVTHQTCAHPSCASWIDDEETGLCHYHAAQRGERHNDAPTPNTDTRTKPDRPAQYLPRVDATCAHQGCTNAADDGDLCRAHQWQQEHPDERYDPFRDFRQPTFGERTRACNPTFPSTTFGDYQPPRTQKLSLSDHRNNDDEHRQQNRKPHATIHWPSGYEETEEPDDEEDDDEPPEDSQEPTDDLPADDDQEPDDEQDRWEEW